MDKLLEKKLDSILHAGNANQKLLMAQVANLNRGQTAMEKNQKALQKE